MLQSRTRFLFPILTIFSLFWFKNHPVIHFAGAENARAELIANLLLGSAMAVFGVIAITSIGRAMGWWK